MELRSKGERSEDKSRSECSSVSKTAAKIVLQSAELRQSVEESVKKNSDLFPETAVRIININYDHIFGTFSINRA